MPSIPADTTPEAMAVQDEFYRRIGGPARSAIAFRLTDLARRATESGIRSRHSDYDEKHVLRALVRLRYGDELAQQVWPNDALVDP